MKKKKRHSWGDIEKNTYTETQQCINCGLNRFKLMGIWAYSKEKITDKNPFVETVENSGCK